MSRTIKGSKGSGYTYWSRRYNKNLDFLRPGRKAKKITNRAERRVSRQKVTHEVCT